MLRSQERPKYQLIVLFVSRSPQTHSERQMLNRNVLAVLGIALLTAASAETAYADTISTSLFSPVAAAGVTPVAINLSGITPPSQSPITGPGVSVAFSGVASVQGVVQGQVPLSHDIPIAGVASSSTPEYLTDGFGSALTTDETTSGNYFSTGLGTVTISFTTPQTSFALLWGSIDPSNSLSFNDSSNFAVTGADVRAAAAGLLINPSQGPGGSAYVVVDTSTPFTTITATSGVVSFEFVGLAGSSQPFVVGVPQLLVGVSEPGSLALFGIGIGLLASRRRS